MVGMRVLVGACAVLALGLLCSGVQAQGPSLQPLTAPAPARQDRLNTGATIVYDAHSEGEHVAKEVPPAVDATGYSKQKVKPPTAAEVQAVQNRHGDDVKDAKLKAVVSFNAAYELANAVAKKESKSTKKSASVKLIPPQEYIDYKTQVNAKAASPPPSEVPDAAPADVSPNFLELAEDYVGIKAPAVVDGSVPCPSKVNNADAHYGDVFNKLWFNVHLSAAAYNLGVNPLTVLNMQVPTKGVDLPVIAGQSVKVQDVQLTGPLTWFGNYDSPAFVATSADTIYVAVRGSDSAVDFVVDAEFAMEPLFIAGDRGMVHSGFLAAYSALDVLPVIMRLRKENPALTNLVFTGHSLGGAVTQLLALEAAIVLRLNPVVYTYGSPRVGDTTFKMWFRKYVTHYRVKDHMDIVPTVPFHGVPRSESLSFAASIPVVDQFVPYISYYHASDVAFRLMPGCSWNCFELGGPTDLGGVADHSLTRYQPRIQGVLNAGLCPVGL